jgi:hypothetical protein
LRSEAVTHCLRTLVHGWVFPFTLDGEIAVEYPFVFRGHKARTVSRHPRWEGCKLRLSCQSARLVKVIALSLPVLLFAVGCSRPVSSQALGLE